MKILAIILGSLFGLAILAGIYSVSMYFHYANYGASREQLLDATNENNKNVLSNYTETIKEMAQVPSMYTADLKGVLEKMFSGRYGPNGSQATMQWIKEHNPNFDSSLYTKLQTTIEAGRREFANNQTKLLDVKREYQTELNQPWSGLWLKFAGYPKIDLSKYQVVVDADVQDKFKTHTDAPIKLR